MCSRNLSSPFTRAGGLHEPWRTGTFFCGSIIVLSWQPYCSHAETIFLREYHHYLEGIFTRVDGGGPASILLFPSMGLRVNVPKLRRDSLWPTVPIRKRWYHENTQFSQHSSTHKRE